MYIVTNTTGTRVGAVEGQLYKPEACGFDSPLMSLEIFIDIILPAALWP